jgi:hypothetical protein
LPGRLETTRRELSGQKLVRNTNQSRASWWHGRCLIGRGKSTDEEHLSVESRDSTNLTLTLATGEGGEGGGRTGEKAADGGGRRRWRVSRRVAVADEIAASPLSLSPRRGLFETGDGLIWLGQFSRPGIKKQVKPSLKLGPTSQVKPSLKLGPTSHRHTRLPNSVSFTLRCHTKQVSSDLGNLRRHRSELVQFSKYPHVTRRVRVRLHAP